MRVRNNPKSKTRLMNSNLELVDPREKNNNWNDIFKNSNPIHLEIGSGKGKFIIDMAKKFPRINFIALETQATILCSLLDKLENTSIENIRLIWGNAVSYTHLRAHETKANLVCRLLLDKKKVYDITFTIHNSQRLLSRCNHYGII